MKTSGIGTMAMRTTLPVRTLIVDDSQLMLQVFTRILTKTNRYEIVGTATDGTQALRLAHTLRPALILMDYRLPDLDGIQATKSIKTFEDPPVIVLITSDDNPGLRSMARGCGCRRFPSQRGGIQMSFGKRTESVHAARPGPGRPGDISPAPVGCIGPLTRPRPGALPLNLSPWKRLVPEQCDTTETRATKEAPVQPSRASSRRPNLPMLIPGILIRRPVIRRLCLQH